MTTLAAPRHPWLSLRSLLILAGALVLTFGAGQLGAVATYPNLVPWYEGLRKPWFNPPNLAFPIAWSILFVLMAVALWRVAMLSDGATRRGALAAFGVQLLFNVGWSFAFFGARSPLLGMIEIVPFFAAILWTVARFRPIDTLAAALLYPYIGWVAFAGVLNFAILWLNG
jgi:benzodiazapine receptor